MRSLKGLKKRLEILENSFDLKGRGDIKVFIYHPEEDIPFWNPEPPETWQEAHPKGHAVILERRSCRIH
jgi:ketosteroid isomerase-like protein